MDIRVYIVTVLIFLGILWNNKWSQWADKSYDDPTDSFKTILASAFWPITAIIGIGVVIRNKWDTWDLCKECGKNHKSKICSKEQVVLGDPT